MGAIDDNEEARYTWVACCKDIQYLFDKKTEIILPEPPHDLIIPKFTFIIRLFAIWDENTLMLQSIDIMVYSILTPHASWNWFVQKNHMWWGSKYNYHGVSAAQNINTGRPKTEQGEIPHMSG